MLSHEQYHLRHVYTYVHVLAAFNSHVYDAYHDMRRSGKRERERERVSERERERKRESLLAHFSAQHQETCCGILLVNQRSLALIYHLCPS